MKRDKISIIIPVYNEAEILSESLQKIRNQISKTNHVGEILLVDGGSTDQTVDVAKKMKGIQLIHSKKGRPIQMNFGAKHAQFEVLYFLHIDSYPPKNFDQLIINEISKGHLAGCFRMKFRSHHPWLILISWLTIFNSQACRGGDQSQFITQELFFEIGGYPEDYLIYEDQILINQLYQRQQFKVIPHWLTTSARRFEEVGVWRLQLIFWKIYWLKWSGKSPNEIYQYYQSKFSSSE